MTDATEPNVAEVLQQLRSGVRQRTAELAAIPSDAGGIRAKLLEMRSREFVREPTPVSHRAGLGTLIVLVRKAMYKLFGKWYARPVLEQQNAFNQAASAASQDMASRQEELLRRIEALQHRVERLERGEAAGPSDAARGGAGTAGSSTS